jgi:hypothetical protein
MYKNVACNSHWREPTWIDVVELGLFKAGFGHVTAALDDCVRRCGSGKVVGLSGRNVAGKSSPGARRASPHSRAGFVAALIFSSASSAVAVVLSRSSLSEATAVLYFVSTVVGRMRGTRCTGLTMSGSGWPC